MMRTLTLALILERHQIPPRKDVSAGSPRRGHAAGRPSSGGWRSPTTALASMNVSSLECLRCSPASIQSESTRAPAWAWLFQSELWTVAREINGSGQTLMDKVHRFERSKCQYCRKNHKNSLETGRFPY